MTKIHVIVNPAAGLDSPILSHINKAFNKPGINWEVSVTKKYGDAGEIAKKMIGKVDVIAVAGGDGTVTEVAQALYKSLTPLGIIPEGTANIMAKELHIPLVIPDALKLIKGIGSKVKKVDMAEVNGTTFLSLIHVGFMGDMVKNTKRSKKDKWGIFAYPLSFMNTISEAVEAEYELTLDGQKVVKKGVQLLVGNTGNVGIQGISFVHNIRVSDGLLDVILVKKSNPKSLIELLQTSLFKRKVSETDNLDRWKAKEIRVKVIPKQTIVVDDKTYDWEEMDIKVVPKAIKIIVPNER